MFTVALSILSTLTSSILVFVVTNLLKENRDIRARRREENIAKEESIANGVLCLLRVKLIEYHDHYTELGSIPSYARSNWDMMYEAYHDLGGNGMITGMDSEIKKLKIV